jgi:hypothetical protein
VDDPWTGNWHIQSIPVPYLQDLLFFPPLHFPEQQSLSVLQGSNLAPQLGVGTGVGAGTGAEVGAGVGAGVGTGVEAPGAVIVPV